MPLYYSNFKSFSNKISRIFWFQQLFCMAFISYTERPISALSSTGEAGARLVWVDFNFAMSQQAPISWALNSWAAQANHGHPILHIALTMVNHSLIPFSVQKAKPSFNLKNNKIDWLCLIIFKGNEQAKALIETYDTSGDGNVSENELRQVLNWALSSLK